MIDSWYHPFFQLPFYPLQRIQTILQTQNTYLPPEKRYKNSFDLIKRLPKEENTNWYESYYRGFFPHTLSSILGYGTFFGPIFLLLGYALPVTLPIAVLTLIPGHWYQLASLKIQAEVNCPEKRNFSLAGDCFKQIEEVDGWKGKYRGLSLSIPLLITEAYAMSLISFGLISKRSFIKGLRINILAYPLDVIRKRYMIESGDKDKKYNGYIDCFSQIVQEEGWQSLFSGLEVKMFRDLLFFNILPSGLRLLASAARKIL